jgi:glycerophosphoryl diester phosphodiesterase
LNIAHRGASGRFPENTLTAFRAAIEAGADMCELDVQSTRDGAVVVMHDDTLDRTTDGHGALSALTLAEAKALNIVNGRDRTLTGEHAPTLDEVFALTRGRCALNIELKGEGVEAAVCRSVRDNGELEKSMVSSFDWSALERARAIEPEIRIGVLAERGRTRMLAAAAELKAFAINPRFGLVDAALCAEAHRRGLQVYVWTVDDAQAMRSLLDCGVDGIMTNYPERLRALIEE